MEIGFLRIFSHWQCFTLVADVYEQKKRAWRNLIVPILGQVFTFLLGLGGMACGVLLSLKGMEAGAVAAILTGFSPILIQAIKSLKK